MKKEQIQAIGNFLAYYHSDLNYIKQFHDFKENKISMVDFVKKETGTFYSFLIEYRIVRNFTQGSTDKLLIETLNWVNSNNADNVDKFAKMLAKTKLTRGNTSTSLASKILFLNNPWVILPMDRLTRSSFKQNENNYSVYSSNLEKYRISDNLAIGECLQYVKPLTTIIHHEFDSKIKDLNLICENRIVDKLLWTTRNNGSLK